MAMTLSPLTETTVNVSRYFLEVPPQEGVWNRQWPVIENHKSRVRMVKSETGKLYIAEPQPLNTLIVNNYSHSISIVLRRILKQ